MFAETAAPNSNSQHRLSRLISTVLLGLLQGLDQDLSLYCIQVEAIVVYI